MITVCLLVAILSSGVTGVGVREVKAYWACRQYMGARDVNLENQIANEFINYRRNNGLRVPVRYSTFERGASTRLQYMHEINQISHYNWFSNLQGCGITPWAGEVQAPGWTGNAPGMIQSWHNSPAHNSVIRYGNIRYFGVRCAIYNKSIPVPASGFSTNRDCILVVSD